MADDSYDDEHAVTSSLPMNFPEGLRVLAVDANEVCLKLLVRLLEQCRYKVTSTRNPVEALKKLERNKAKFDIVITDVKNLDMDGFSLLDIVVLEYDLPVIMISADDSNSTVMKGIRHGARDYLLKPVRLEEMKNIWQHVVRRFLLTSQPIPNTTNNSCIIIKDDTNNAQSSSPLKTHSKRLVWTVKLHNKFVDAIEQLGNDAVPKKILGVMNEPGLTRTNVASHLQKFRKMLKNPQASQEGKITKNPQASQEGKITKNPQASQEGRITRARSRKTGGSSSSIASLNQQMKTSDMHCNTNANTVHLQSDHFSMPESSFHHSDSILELSPLSQLPPVNQQDVLLQQFSPAAPQSVDQMMQPRRHNVIPMLENASPTPLWIENYTPMQELNGLELPFCSSEAGQSSNPPPITNQLRSSYPSASSLYDRAYRLPGPDASTRMIKTPQLSSDHVPAQNFIIGKHEGGNMFGLDGGADSGSRQQMSSPSLGVQGTLIHPLERYPSITSLLNPRGISETESGFHFITRSSSEDDLMTMVKQFGSDGAPDVNQWHFP